MVHSIHGTYKIQYHPNGVGEDPVYEVSSCMLFFSVFLPLYSELVELSDEPLCYFLSCELIDLTIFKVVKL